MFIFVREDLPDQVDNFSLTLWNWTESNALWYTASAFSINYFLKIHTWTKVLTYVKGCDTVVIAAWTKIAPAIGESPFLKGEETAILFRYFRKPGKSSHFASRIFTNLLRLLSCFPERNRLSCKCQDGGWSKANVERFKFKFWKFSQRCYGKISWNYGENIEI